MDNLIVSGLMAGAFTVLAVPVLRKAAPRLGLLDHPDDRKRHRGSVPMVGGLAMLLALCVTTAVNGPGDRLPIAALLVAVGIALIGLIDDKGEISSRGRLLLQTVAIAVAVVFSGNHYTDLGQIFGPFIAHLGLLAIPFTVFSMVGIVNAFNLCDGLDGLAGGVALTSMLTLIAAALMMQADMGHLPAELNRLMPLAAAMCGALLGFLAFNMRIFGRQQASVFMGDAGSLFLGFVLAWMAVKVSRHGAQGGLPPVCALWALLVPLFDTVGAIVRRVIDGRSPMSADRQHFHHLLLEQGLSVKTTVVVLVLLNAAAGVVGLVGWRLHLPEWLMFAVFLGAFAVYLRLTIRSWKRLAQAQPSTNAQPSGSRPAQVVSLPLTMSVAGAKRVQDTQARDRMRA